MALDTTVGGASADSYGTLAEYLAYVQASIDLNYDGVGQESTHEMNLRRAAQVIDRQYSFVGMQQYQTQARSWPRLTDTLVDGWPIDPDTVPTAIKHAQFELAYAIEVDGVDPLATLTTGAVTATRAKAGPVETETTYDMGRSLPRVVAIEGLLAAYITGGRQGQIRLGRG